MSAWFLDSELSTCSLYNGIDINVKARANCK